MSESLRSIEIVLIVAITAVIGVDSIGAWMISAFLPGWLDDKGLSSSWSGVVFAANSIGGLITCLLAPWIIKATSNAFVLTFGPMLVAIVYLFAAWLPGLLHGNAIAWVLSILRFISGLVEGVLFVACTALVLRIVPKSQGPTYVGAMEGIRALGMLVGPVIGSPLYEAGGYYLPFLIEGLVLAACSLCLCAVIAFLPKDVRHSSDVPETAAEQLKRVASIQTLCLSIALTLAPIAGVLIQPVLEPYLIDPPFNLSSSTVGALFALFSVVDIISASLSGPVARIIGAFSLFVGCNVVATIGAFVLSATAHSLGSIIVCICLLYCGGYPSVMSCLIIFQQYCLFLNLDPKEYSEVTVTVVNAGLYVSFTIGTATAGALYDSIGMKGIFIVSGCLSISSMLALLIPFHPYFLKGVLPPPPEDDASKDSSLEKKAEKNESSSKNNRICDPCLCRPGPETKHPSA